MAFASVRNTILGAFDLDVSNDLLSIQFSPIHKGKKLQPCQLPKWQFIGKAPLLPFFIPETTPKLRCIQNKTSYNPVQVCCSGSSESSLLVTIRELFIEFSSSLSILIEVMPAGSTGLPQQFHKVPKFLIFAAIVMEEAPIRFRQLPPRQELLCQEVVDFSHLLALGWLAVANGLCRNLVPLGL